MSRSAYQNVLMPLLKLKKEDWRKSIVKVFNKDKGTDGKT